MATPFPLSSLSSVDHHVKPIPPQKIDRVKPIFLRIGVIGRFHKLDLRSSRHITAYAALSVGGGLGQVRASFSLDGDRVSQRGGVVIDFR